MSISVYEYIGCYGVMVLWSCGVVVLWSCVYMFVVVIFDNISNYHNPP